MKWLPLPVPPPRSDFTFILSFLHLFCSWFWPQCVFICLKGEIRERTIPETQIWNNFPLKFFFLTKDHGDRMLMNVSSVHVFPKCWTSVIHYYPNFQIVLWKAFSWLKTRNWEFWQELARKMVSLLYRLLAAQEIQHRPPDLQWPQRKGCIVPGWAERTSRLLPSVLGCLCCYRLLVYTLSSPLLSSPISSFQWHSLHFETALPNMRGTLGAETEVSEQNRADQEDRLKCLTLVAAQSYTVTLNLS